MSRVAKSLAVLGTTALFLYGAVVAFSASESRFRCDGTLSSRNGAEAIEVYVKVAEYRWWVGLWSSSDGAMWLEIPNKTVEYYSHLVEVGDQLQVHRNPGELSGNFSMLSHALTLKTPLGFFDGTCKEIDA